MAFDWKPYFYYYTPKRLKVAYWEVGAVQYVLYILVMIWFGYDVLHFGTYLHTQEVDGAVMPYAIERSFSSPSALSYCTNYSFHFDDSFFIYENPVCTADNIYTINSKAKNYISFSTVYVEWQYLAWPCDETDGAYAQDAINNQCDTNTFQVDPTGQCLCTKVESYFPMNVEDSVLVINSLYKVQNFCSANLFDQGCDTWSGASDIEEVDHEIIFEWPNGTKSPHRAGQKLRITLRELLALAHVNSLDDPYVGSHTTDVRGTGQYPSFRTTGLDLQVTMDYFNRDQHSESHNIFFGFDQLEKDVDVKLGVTRSASGWSSVGPTNFYKVSPTGSPGNQTFIRVVKYPQDIVIHFVPQGIVHRYDLMAVITAVISVVVLLTVIDTIIGVFVFYMLPDGTAMVLRNKRDELTDRTTAFAELGVKAAVAVNQFRDLDRRKTGSLEKNDFQEIFNQLPDVDEIKAKMIAASVVDVGNLNNQMAGLMDDGQGTGDVHQHRVTRKRGQALNFSEFVSLTSGDATTFSDYLKLVDYGPGGSKDECAVVTLRLMKAAVESALKKAADLVKPKPTTGVNADPVQSL